MKRLIIASNKVSNSSDNILDKMRAMSTIEITRDKQAVDYCYELEDIVTDAALSVSKGDGWDDSSSEINSNNGDLQFRTRGCVYTKSKKLIESVCDAIESELKKSTPFKDNINITYTRDTTNYSEPCYVVEVSAYSVLDENTWR